MSRDGANQYANTLDTIGWYGRSVADLSLVAKIFRIPEADHEELFTASDLKVALCKSPFWDKAEAGTHKAEAGTHKAFALASERLTKAGVAVNDLTLPEPFNGMYGAQQTIMFGEGRASFLSENLIHGPALHQDFIDRAQNSKGTPEQMLAVYNLAAECRARFDALFADFDVILTPASTGEAPEGLQNTGNAIFNAMWTLLHVPCISIPCTFGAK